MSIVRSKKISLGLDIGTNSIGWAVVDENNDIVKHNDFSMWGVRMFDEAKDASERRTFRTSRRRLQRRKERINLIQDIFNEEINSIDKNFFQRLNDSFYKQEDKELNNKYIFFDDNITDKEYFTNYPTIYHLRKDLLNKDEKFDIRYLYLAVHHIVKYRGNFLQEGEIFNKDDATNVISNFNIINNYLLNAKNEFEEEQDYFDEIKKINDKDFLTKLRDILIDTEYIKEKKGKLLDLFGVSTKSFVYEFIIQLLCGSVVNVSNLKIVKDLKYEKSEIDLSNDELETEIEKAKSIVTELNNILDICYEIKSIRDYYFLVKLLGDYNSISEAMVDIYDKHNKDLKTLKNLIKEYIPDKYNECFRIKKDNLNNYCSYVGYISTQNKITRYKHCTKENFYLYLKNLLSNINNENANNTIKTILFKIDNGTFLQRQNSGQNTSIPMQLHLYELKKILNNQAKYYKFLNDKSDNITNLEKIISIFKFKIPYYVGPLNNKSDKSWVVRTNEKVYPWNFDEVINKDESAKRFIEKMQNKCTYLHGNEDYCLPKKSLLFSEFNCLQYLNKITIDGKPIEKEVKLNIYNNVFLKYKKPTRKIIEEFLYTNYGIKCDRFTSKIEDVTCDMSSYITFKEIFGNDFDDNIDKIENIIKDITIFEDKKILVKRLKEIYDLDDDKIKIIKGLNYKGYATLCRNLLSNLIYENDKTGEVFGPIIEIMRESNMNLQEILYYQDFPFIKVIDEYNQKLSNNKLSLEEYIDENIYVSPIFKRPLIQTMKLINEIEQILKQKIDYYYIECTRTNKAEKGEKGKKTTRYNSIKELYKECFKISSELSKYNIDVNKLNKILESNKDNLRSDKIYLYLTQLGKDLYTLKDMDLDDVIAGTYDIDHIYPQAVIKDDSLSNRVLVSKYFNQSVKKDNFLFEVKDRLPKNANNYYQFLLDNKLITQEKYRRLTENEISIEKLDGFVNRQLVATNQAVKGVIELLKNYKHVSNENIIYSKAENVSDFRHKYDIYKSRIANNYHHAHDAYLNVVVGSVIDKYYKSYNFYRFKDYYEMKSNYLTVNPINILDKDVVYSRNKKEIIWNKDESIKLIKYNIFENFDIHETTRTFNSNEMFKKVTILPASLGKVCIKNNLDVNKYGGITSNSYAQYSLVKFTNKKILMNIY